MSVRTAKPMNRVEHPIGCPICGGHWDFKTDYIGRLVALHPVTKCVPRQPVAEQPEDEWSDRPMRPCIVCEKLFPLSPDKPSQRICSVECRVARRDGRREESKRDRGPEWKLRVMQTLSLPTKQCTECNSWFTVSGPLAKKQIVCSLKCRRSREKRLGKMRAA